MSDVETRFDVFTPLGGELAQYVRIISRFLDHGLYQSLNLVFTRVYIVVHERVNLEEEIE